MEKNNKEKQNQNMNSITSRTINNIVLHPGYRFQPTDQELITHYLMKKVNNELPEPCHNIQAVNIYDHHPQLLTSLYKVQDGEDWYFFTPRKRKYPNGFRPSRAASDGFWRAIGSDTCIRDGTKEIGYKKSLEYYEGKPQKGGKPPPKDAKTEWKMHEYRLHLKSPPAVPNQNNDAGDSMKLDDCVLCRIYKKRETSKNKSSDFDETKQGPDASPETSHKAEGLNSETPGPIQQPNHLQMVETLDLQPIHSFDHVTPYDQLAPNTYLFNGGGDLAEALISIKTNSDDHDNQMLTTLPIEVQQPNNSTNLAYNYNYASAPHDNEYLEDVVCKPMKEIAPAPENHVDENCNVPPIVQSL